MLFVISDMQERTFQKVNASTFKQALKSTNQNQGKVWKKNSNTFEVHIYDKNMHIENKSIYAVPLSVKVLFGIRG